MLSNAFYLRRLILTKNFLEKNMTYIQLRAIGKRGIDLSFVQDVVEGYVKGRQMGMNAGTGRGSKGYRSGEDTTPGGRHVS